MLRGNGWKHLRYADAAELEKWADEERTLHADGKLFISETSHPDDEQIDEDAMYEETEDQAEAVKKWVRSQLPNPDLQLHVAPFTSHGIITKTQKSYIHAL